MITGPTVTYLIHSHWALLLFSDLDYYGIMLSEYKYTYFFYIRIFIIWIHRHGIDRQIAILFKIFLKSICLATPRDS